MASESTTYKPREGYNAFEEPKFEEYPRISDIEECVKETVIGQNELVGRIATSLYNAHYMDIKCVEFIIGGSGTGKSLTVESFCHEMGLAYTIETATQYTQEGYEGESVCEMLTNLVENAGGDFQKAENGILAIDEIGKKTTKGKGNNDGRDVSGEGVIDSLLPLLDGKPMTINYKNRKYKFETKNLRIFLMDACSGIEKIREKRLKKSSMGFQIECNQNEEVLSSEDCIYTKGDLIEYGYSPEFVGRISKIHVTNPIEEDTMVRIQKESKNSIFRKYERGLKKMNIELIVYPDFFKEVAAKTLDYKTGARELNNTTNKVFELLMHEIYDSIEKPKAVELQEGITKDNSKFKFIK